MYWVEGGFWSSGSWVQGDQDPSQPRTKRGRNLGPLEEDSNLQTAAKPWTLNPKALNPRKA